VRKEERESRGGSMTFCRKLTLPKACRPRRNDKCSSSDQLCPVRAFNGGSGESKFKNCIGPEIKC